MDFEIEDDDDPYDFQSNWSTKDKGGGFGFGGKDNDGGDDAYNYDFGSIKEETSHYSDIERSKKSTVSKKDSAPVAKSKPKPATGGNAMEKAAAMLDKYSGKSTANKPVPAKTLKNTSLDFDEDDISISMGSDDSYDDSFTNKKNTNNKTKAKAKFEPDSPLYGGLDSDIPHMKKKSQFNTASSFKEPTINESRGFDLEEEDDEEDEPDLHASDFVMEASMEDSTDDINKIDSGPSVYPSSKLEQEDESMDDYSKDDFDDGEETKPHGNIKRSEEEEDEALETFGESVQSFDDIEEEANVPAGEQSESIEYEDDDKGRRGNVMAFNFADLGISDAVSEKYDESLEESRESNAYGASFEEDEEEVALQGKLHKTNVSSESGSDNNEEDETSVSLGMSRSATTTNLRPIQALLDNEEEAGGGKNSNSRQAADLPNKEIDRQGKSSDELDSHIASKQELQAILNESTAAYVSQAGGDKVVFQKPPLVAPPEVPYDKPPPVVTQVSPYPNTASQPVQPQSQPHLQPPPPAQAQVYQHPQQQQQQQQQQPQPQPQQPVPQMYPYQQPQPQQPYMFPPQQQQQPYMYPPPSQPYPQPPYSLPPTPYPGYSYPLPHPGMYAVSGYYPQIPIQMQMPMQFPSGMVNPYAPHIPTPTSQTGSHSQPHPGDTSSMDGSVRSNNSKAESKEVDAVLLEMAKELRIAKEEATYATQRLADVIMDLHHSKPDEMKGNSHGNGQRNGYRSNNGSPQRHSPRKKNNAQSPMSSLRKLNSSPIIKKSSRNNKSNGTQAQQRAGRVGTSSSIEEDEEEEGDDEYSYDEDEFDEESNLNLSMGNPPTKNETSSKSTNKKKQSRHSYASGNDDDTADDGGDADDDGENNQYEKKGPVHKPHSSLKNSTEFEWNSKATSSQARYSPDYEYEGGRVGGHSHSRRSRLDEHSHRGRDSYMDSYSHRDSFSYRDSYSHRDRERESFDGVLRASQNLFQRQLATLRDRLATINHDTSSSVAASINLPNYTSSGHTWAAPRRNVSSSLSAIKGDFQSQRHEQQNKLMKALLVVDPTLSQDEVAALMEKYS